MTHFMHHSHASSSSGFGMGVLPAGCADPGRTRILPIPGWGEEMKKGGEDEEEGREESGETGRKIAGGGGGADPPRAIPTHA